MKKAQKYQHLFFDMDGTITQSCSPITKKMLERMRSLSKDIIVISGARIEQIRSQIKDLECFVMGQNGNHTVFGKDELWRDVLHPDKVIEIMDHINSLERDWDVPNENDLLEDRDCQISYSLYGHHAPLAEKEVFDPDGSRRKELLKKHPLVSDSVEVKIAGTATLDYTRKGRHKGYNIQRLIDQLGWKKEDCLYFGDSLFEGGNDETVVGVIDTEEVKDPTDLYKKLENFV